MFLGGEEEEGGVFGGGLCVLKGEGYVLWEESGYVFSIGRVWAGQMCGGRRGREGDGEKEGDMFSGVGRGRRRSFFLVFWGEEREGWVFLARREYVLLVEGLGYVLVERYVFCLVGGLVGRRGGMFCLLERRRVFFWSREGRRRYGLGERCVFWEGSLFVAYSKEASFFRERCVFLFGGKGSVFRESWKVCFGL